MKGIYIIVALSFALASAQTNFNTTNNYIAERYTGAPFARVSRAVSRITAIFEENGQVQTATLVDNLILGLNHGIAIKNGSLYASSSTTVYKWPYTAGQRTGITTAAQVVIKGIPIGVHTTRALAFDSEGLLYVQVGSSQNVDPDSSHARIRRFSLPDEIPNGGIDFSTGEVFADGLRNEVGITFDSDGVLWGVQNGADNLNREDLGGDIHNTNPADELTKYDQPVGTFYGYPYCWTVDELQGHQRGEQFAWPTFINDGIHTDEWCKNVSNNHPPTLPLPAHYAALGITFYDGSVCNSSEGAFPCSMKGDAFVTFHGSWNRNPAEGFKVVRIPINPETRLPTGEILDVMFEPDPVNCARCFRPVSLIFNKNGHLMVSADASSEVFRIKYEGESS